MAERGGIGRPGDFLKLWAGQTVSLFCSQITVLAIPLLAAGTAPDLLISLVAGVWVDRLRRRPLLIAADLGRAERAIGRTGAHDDRGDLAGSVRRTGDRPRGRAAAGGTRAGGG
jgi:hypothetical protein